MGTRSPYYPDWMSDERVEEWLEARRRKADEMWHILQVMGWAALGAVLTAAAAGVLFFLLEVIVLTIQARTGHPVGR
jgi:hypothetical protein